jgi:hypothetical protein
LWRASELLGCVLFAGDGGGIWIAIPSDPQASTDCPSPTTYWPYSHGVLILIMGSMIDGNSATSPVSSGGGLHLSSGGLLFVASSKFHGNSAGLFGGGLGLGTGDNSDTCALQLAAGTDIADNTAGHGSAQVFMGCAADISVAIPINLTSMGSQVCLPEILCTWSSSLIFPRSQYQCAPSYHL